MEHALAAASGYVHRGFVPGHASVGWPVTLVPAAPGASHIG